jgi:hypothetical protein
MVGKPLTSDKASALPETPVDLRVKNPKMDVPGMLDREFAALCPRPGGQLAAGRTDDPDVDAFEPLPM